MREVIVVDIGGNEELFFFFWELEIGFVGGEGYFDLGVGCIVYWFVYCGYLRVWMVEDGINWICFRGIGECWVKIEG